MLKTDPRIPLACVLCRARHVRCDGVMPTCTRCRNEKKNCAYAESRRGERFRAARGQAATSVSEASPVQLFQAFSTDFAIAPYIGEARSTPYPSGSIETTDNYSEQVNRHPSCSANVDYLLGLYYTYFHSAHPCALPLQAFKQRLEVDPDSLRLVVLVMSFIGSFYTQSVQSEPLESQLRAELSIVQRYLTGFDVQAYLLYSIAVYWSDEIERSVHILDQAISMALDMGMHHREFAYIHGQGDSILEECWRRTWWQVYITDLCVASSHHALTWKTSCIATTVELPCEEVEYESMTIPRPRTLQEYENREFFSHDHDNRNNYSSFAHVVGLARSMDFVLAGASRTEEASAKQLCNDVDAAIVGWVSHLSKAKRDLTRADGTIDELLFIAHVIVHTYVADVHRPLSALAYCPIESASRCAPPAPPTHLSPARIHESHTHTSKILHAIEAQTELLTMPVQLSRGSPFLICMIANTTIAHLSACKHVLKGRSLRIARERIRASMGALKALEDIWELGKRTRREVGIVAREILALDESEYEASSSSPTLNEALYDMTTSIDFDIMPGLSGLPGNSGQNEETTAALV